MKARTDWFAVWPMAAAGVAFGVVYAMTLAMGETVETVLARSVATLLVVGLAGMALQAVLGTARRDPEPPASTIIDITLPEEGLDVIEAPGMTLLPDESGEELATRRR